jgi:hypothetical protein
VAFPVLVSFVAAGVSVAVTLHALARDHRAFTHRVFSIGMSLVGVHELFVGLGLLSTSPEEAIQWYRLQAMTGAVLPGPWLIFSLSFARANHRDYLRQWRWVIGLTLALPVVLVAFGLDTLVGGASRSGTDSWVFSLGGSGLVLNLFSALATALIVVNMVGTLRAATGSMRWQVKFTVLGLSAFFAAQIYRSSHALLHSRSESGLATVGSLAIVVASFLILISTRRAGKMRPQVYLSQGFVYRSLIALFVGVYLLAVGWLAKGLAVRSGSGGLPLVPSLVLLSLLGLVILLLSDEARVRFDRFLSDHLHRPKHDYRQVWNTLTRRTSSLMGVRALSGGLVATVSDVYGASSVSLWLVSEQRDRLFLGGSTAFSEELAQEILNTGDGGKLLLKIARGLKEATDLKKLVELETGESRREQLRFLRRAQIRICAPLHVGSDLLGLLTVGEPITKEPLSAEDLGLLDTIATQTAAYLLNRKLSEQLVRAQVVETFETLSAFHVHDLKNLAARLSLAMQNLPSHYDDPAFRADLTHAISQSVDNINSLCERFLLLSQGLKLKPIETDLAGLVQDTVATLDGTLRSKVVPQLEKLPNLTLDPQQIQKVLVNLLLNADEAMVEPGEILVEARAADACVELAVTDRGSGMSGDFMARYLFKPFHTTKNKGLGIGLFQSKRIVEAHEGRIEAESRVGEGTTFRVLLPVPEPLDHRPWPLPE